MKRQGMNMERVKHQNRALILGYINDNGPVSRKDIALATGLTPASLTQISNQLISEGLLVELGTSDHPVGVVGRKKVLLDIDAAAFLVYTINIEPGTTTVAVCDLKGRLVKGSSGAGLEKAVYTDRSMEPEAFLRSCADVCRSLGAELPDVVRSRIASVSVGVTGLVDLQNGVSVHAYGVWKKRVDIRKVLTEELGLEVIIENNVDALAQAELLFGEGRKKDNLLIIKWGPGVGSTIVTDGKIYKGRQGKTAELGHFIVKKNGRQCSCGRCGCLETEVSYYALREKLEFTLDDLGEKYKNASADVKAYIDSAIDLFARCIVNAGTLIAPNRIVLAGGMFRSTVIREALIKACSCYDSAYNEKRIIYTTLHGREGYVGPAAVYASKKLC